jgi:phenylpyruvate tautomerase PptA (4-oxalocrotonate tautomerase family)
MPLVRIDVVKGRSRDQLDALLLAIHEAMVAAFDVPNRDRYQVLTEHEPANLLLEDTGLGFDRTENRVLVQVFTRPRSVEKKRMLYTITASYLCERLGMQPEDVMITCSDNADMDWSFAHGQAQFLMGEL